MFLKQVEIENFKGHVNCKLKLTSGFNLLIGDNGMGKTSILEAISVALGAFIAGIEDVSSKHFTLNFQSFRPYVVFKASEHTGALSVVWGYLVL